MQKLIMKPLKRKGITHSYLSDTQTDSIHFALFKFTTYRIRLKSGSVSYDVRFYVELNE